MKRSHHEDPTVTPYPITIRSSQSENEHVNRNRIGADAGGASSHVLDLSQNRIQAEHIHYFTYILPTDTVMEELQLNNNHATKCVGAEVIATSLEQNTSVKVVNLMNSRIREDGVRALANMLQHSNSSIEVLHLSGNPCGSAGALALADALEDNMTLQVLSLDGCRIGSDGISALANILCANHPSLQELRIRGNAGGTVGEARKLATALKNNTVIRALLVGFRSEHLSESIKILRDAMQYNISLNYLFIMENQSREYIRPADLNEILQENQYYGKYASQREIHHALIPFILAKSNRPSFLFKVLQCQVNVVAEGLQSHQHDLSYLSLSKRRRSDSRSLR